MLSTTRLATASIIAALALISPAAGEGVTQAIGSAKAGTYNIEPYHTQVVFALNHLGFTNFSGTFSEASGSLQLDPAKLGEAKLQVSVPVGSVLTPVAKLNDELKAADWFDAAKYPTATFTSLKVTPADKENATVAGTLTLHGVTKPVTLNVHFIGAGVNPLDKAYTVGFEATGTIKRSDFGVSKYVPLVGDDVHLTIAGAFELKQ